MIFNKKGSKPLFLFSHIFRANTPWSAKKIWTPGKIVFNLQVNCWTPFSHCNSQVRKNWTRGGNMILFPPLLFFKKQSVIEEQICDEEKERDYHSIVCECSFTFSFSFSFLFSVFFFFLFFCWSHFYSHSCPKPIFCPLEKKPCSNISRNMMQYGTGRQ